MRYLVLDAMVSGTGVRDAFEGGYLALSSLEVSVKWQEQVTTWLARYREQHYVNFSDAKEVASLDAEGVELVSRLREELPGSKVEYFSAAKLMKIPLSVHGT